VSSLLFVTGLSLSITGVRGALVMACAASLGVLAPLAGIRRLQLMGSLLVPIWILFVTAM
jgi:TctA family transporter